MNILSDKLACEQTSIRSIGTFCGQFKVGAALKSSHAYKTKGIPVLTVVKYLMCLVFTGKSMFEDMRSKEPIASGFSKDTVYRLMNTDRVNWQTFLLKVAAAAVAFIRPLTSVERLCAFVIDDSMFPRLYGEKVELCGTVFDHAAKGRKYKPGFRLLTLAFTDGYSLIPLCFRHLTSRKKELRKQEAKPGIDRRSCGGRIRKEALQKANDLIIPMLKRAMSFGIPARHVLFDCWFAHPVTILKIKELGLMTVCRLKKGKTKYLFEGSKSTLTHIYNSRKKRPGKSRYLLSVEITLGSQAEDSIPARIVYIRDRSNRKKWIALLSTDMDLSEEEIIALYGKRWDIEVFFKMCKSYLKLTGEFRQLSYDAITAHTTVVFLRYIMLTIERRKQNDPRSLAEIFFEVYDQIGDIRFEKAIQLILTLLQDILRNPLIELTDEQIDMIHTEFILGLPEFIRVCVAPGVIRQAA